MVYHQQLPDTFVADAVLAGQDQGVGEELLAAGADQLPLYVLDGNLETEGHRYSDLLGCFVLFLQDVWNAHKLKDGHLRPGTITYY